MPLYQIIKPGLSSSNPDLQTSRNGSWRGGIELTEVDPSGAEAVGLGLAISFS
jgi:hypothetical protein